MLILSSDNFIGEGAFRACYSHPDDVSLCIKVFKRDITKNSRDFRELSRELKYYKRLGERKICWDLLPRYHGIVSTNIGDGYVFDLVRDSDGGVSKTLEYYLRKDNLLGVEDALLKLGVYLLNNAVVTRVMQPRNIVLQKKIDGSYNAFVIDDVMNNELIPISSYIEFFARSKSERRFERFKKSLYQYGLFIK